MNRFQALCVVALACGGVALASSTPTTRATLPRDASFDVQLSVEGEEGDAESLKKENVKGVRRVVQAALASNRSATTDKVRQTLRNALEKAYPGNVTQTDAVVGYVWKWDQKLGEFVLICRSQASLRVQVGRNVVVLDVPIQVEE
jgi:hypothetical protein